MSLNIYQLVTDRIIAQLENNIIPWHRPWHGSEPINYVTRKAYRGINTLLLERGGEYLTFKQCKDAGGSVHKGEKSSIIVFYKPIDHEDPDTGEIRKIPYLKYSNVFHLSQCSGIESKLEPIKTDTEIEPIQAAQTVFDDYITRSGVTVNHIEGSNSASYSPSADSITLPVIGQFESSQEYYSTAYHEAAHSTGHQSRLDRLTKTAAFGSGEYSKEELIAEIASAMVMNSCGAEIEQTFQNSAAYIAAWLRKLREDNKIIVTASSAAQKAADLILGVTQPALA